MERFLFSHYLLTLPLMSKSNLFHLLIFTYFVTITLRKQGEGAELKGPSLNLY